MTPTSKQPDHPSQEDMEELNRLYKTVRNNSRMILYTDQIGRPDEDNQREQVSRDDLWAISTEELNQFRKLVENQSQAISKAVAEAERKAFERAFMITTDADVTDIQRDDLLAKLAGYGGIGLSTPESKEK